MKEYNKSAFVADVIKALEDAERASQQNQKNKETLARDAYSKLHYDYPLVSEQELLALTAAVYSKEPWAVISDRILTVLYDCISRGSLKTGGTAPIAQHPEPGPSSSASSAATEDLEADALLAAFQKLYILFILSTMTEALLQATPEAAAQVLRQLTSLATGTETNTMAVDGAEVLELSHFNLSSHDDTANIIDVTQDMDDEFIDKDDDDGLYEPLDILPIGEPVAVAGTAIGKATPPFASVSDVEISKSISEIIVSNLLYLSSKLSYHVVSSSSAWQDGIILSSLGKCSSALREHPSFLQLLPAAGAVCSVLHDRCVHSVNPAEFETAMAAVVEGLRLEEERKKTSTAAAAAMLLGLQTAASLSRRLPQGPSRRKLWTLIDTFWLQLAAEMLERRETVWRQKKKKNNSGAVGVGDAAKMSGMLLEAEDVDIIAISALITEFYILEAPVVVKMDKIQDVLLSTGLFKGLVLSFINYGRELVLESLRRSLLICCASSAGLLTWARAVPGFSTAWDYPEFAVGGSLARYSAVHASLFGLSGGDEAVASALLLGSLEKTGSSGLLTAEDVPEVYITLELVESVQKAMDRAARGESEISAAPKFLSGGKTVAALESLSSSLRALKVELDDISGENNKDSIVDERIESEKAREEEKMALSSEAQAGKLASRRAKLLQPECLRMIKGLRAKPGSVGKGD